MTELTITDIILSRAEAELAALEKGACEQTLRQAYVHQATRNTALCQWLKRFELPIPNEATDSIKLNDQFTLTVSDTGNVCLATLCQKCGKLIYGGSVDLVGIANQMRGAFKSVCYNCHAIVPPTLPQPDPLDELQRQIAEAEDCNAHDKAMRKLQALTALALVEIARRMSL